jgi:carotenoid cleavage dioxygenase-like enzyme
MIHAFQIHDGQLSYCNRYTKTPKYTNEKKAGKKIQVGLSDLSDIGVFLAPLEKSMIKLGYLTNIGPQLRLLLGLQQGQKNDEICEVPDRQHSNDS